MLILRGEVRTAIAASRLDSKESRCLMFHMKESTCFNIPTHAREMRHLLSPPPLDSLHSGMGIVRLYDKKPRKGHKHNKKYYNGLNEIYLNIINYSLFFNQG